MLYNRLFMLADAKEILNDSSYVFIYSALDCEEGKENRSNVCKNALTSENSIGIYYSVHGESEEGFILDSFKAVYNDEELFFDSLRPKNMRYFAEIINKNCRRIVVDFTSMNIRFLGSFISAICFYEWDMVFFCYTEPQNYPINYQNSLTKKFDLKNVTYGFEQIPGLETTGDESSKSNWIVFFGFENERVKRMSEEVSMSREYIVPVVCIPPMKAIWHNYAIEVNLAFLESQDKMDKLSYVSAINPFDVYNYLNQEKNNYHRLVISPISTKPVILGSLMYILENTEDMLLWDSPIQYSSDIEAHGKTIFYDLTYFFFKNRR